MGTISIRQARAGDVDEAMRLVRDCIACMSRAGIEQWDEIYPDRRTFAADAAEATLFVALEAGGRLAGAFVLNEFQNAEYDAVPWTIPAARVAVVHRLLVDPICQRRGIAVELMRFAEHRAQALGYDVIRLDAFEHNPTALRLYQRLGYHDAGCVTLRKGVFRCFEKRVLKLPASL